MPEFKSLHRDHAVFNTGHKYKPAVLGILLTKRDNDAVSHEGVTKHFAENKFSTK